MKRLLLGIALWLLSLPACAQTQFITPNTGYANGEVPMCDNGSSQYVACTKSNPVPVSLSAPGPYPAGAAPQTISATGTTASVTATLPGAASKTTYICGFTITAGATVGLGGTATVTNAGNGTLSYVQPVGALPGVGQLSQSFNPCIPANAVNTGISVNSVAGGLGGTTAVAAWGYQF
jgi:hypothetical protein